MPQAKFQINNYNKSKLTAILSFAVLFLSGVYFLQPFASDNSYAETHTDSASGAYNGTTYSMTTTVSDLNLELYNVTPAGKATYGKQTVNVTTNAPGGYQLYVQTSGSLAGTKEGTATSDSIAALPSNNAALDMNTWGYTKTTPNEDANTAADQTIWNTPPSTITQVDATSSTATSGRDTDIYYGIKADNTLSGDNYSGTITYTTIANDATTDTLLSVSPTSGTAGQATTITVTTSLMTTSTGITASDISAKVGSYTCSSVSITSTAPLKFTCNTSTSLTAGTYTVTATISKYSKTYTKTSAFTVKAGDMSSATYMQDVTSAMCTNSTTWTTSNKKEYTLKDKRDNLEYKVRKLADGHCWMTQNFRMTKDTLTAAGHKATGQTDPAVLTSEDTNLSGTTTYTMPNNASWRNTTATAEGAADASLLPKGSKTGPKASGTEALAHGAYYSWATAVANKNTIGTRSKQTTSICPKGWKLPDSDGSTSTSTNQFQALYNKYNSATSFNQAFNTYYNSSDATNYLAGIWYSDSDQYVSLVGTYGGWWSSTSHSSSANDAWYLGAYTSSIYPSYSHSRYLGLSVRCVLGS